MIVPPRLSVKGSKASLHLFVWRKKNGNRTLFWGRPNTLPYQPNEIPEDFLEDVCVVHLDGLFMEASLHLARLARAKRIPVVLDAGSFRPGMKELIRSTDHFIGSETFARQFAPEMSGADLLFRIRDMGPEMAAITLGEKGSVSLWGDRPQVLPALSIKAKDTTGAGDVFHGAYIYGLIKGWSPPERVRWATVAASLSCLSLGGRTGIPTLETMNETVNQAGSFQPLNRQDLPF